MRESKTCLCERWEQLPTEELDKLLQAELEKEHPDENVVLPILRTIENREKDIPAGNSAKVSQIRDQLSEHETSPTTRIRKGWISAIAAVAAVACIVVMTLPRTVGAESIFDVLFRWTSSIFQFIDPDKEGSKPRLEEVFITDNPGLQQLHDQLTELGMTENVVPMWIPEGLELVTLNASPLPDGHKVSALFQEGERVVSLSYRTCAEKTSKFEKEDSAIEVFEYAEKEHVILENDQNLAVMWKNDNIECSLHTDISKEDVYKMIMSIYRSNF